MYTLITFGLTPVATILADRFGARMTFSLGGILMTLALFLSACATEVWHLYLSQGVLFGFGSAISYMVSNRSAMQQRARTFCPHTDRSNVGCLMRDPSMVSNRLFLLFLPLRIKQNILLGFLKKGVRLWASFLQAQVWVV